MSKEWNDRVARNNQDRFATSEYVTDYQSYRMLALAVCEQAVIDYRDLWLYGHTRGANEFASVDTIEFFETFFQSDDFDLLSCDVIDGIRTMNAIKDSVGRDIVEKREKEIEEKKLRLRREFERANEEWERIEREKKEKQELLEKQRRERIERDRAVLEAALQKAESEGRTIGSNQTTRLLGLTGKYLGPNVKRVTDAGFELVAKDPSRPASFRNPYMLRRKNT